ncbi:GNAT family N-acetyltransferase [Agrobacterium arsenijevicii]|uniref:GCN5 family acetyltransferase n=1 Tax=Agrobacterium arsenijevicii TaxID=1585697 RepID=A0ABR5CZ52_9HYPH|nr:GCN5 family acetyltransferase [Agrobacterium arsenijevicii]
MLEIRPAEAADHGEILQLWHRGWHDAHADLVPSEVLAFRTENHFAVWLKEARDTFYVAINTKLIGFVSVKDAEVVKLYVGKSARGTGVAHALLSFAEQLLFEKGVQVAELFCVAGNSRAETFYKREGWNLSLSFEDALWVPEGVSDRFLVLTHRLQKALMPAAR